MTCNIHSVGNNSKRDRFYENATSQRLNPLSAGISSRRQNLHDVCFLFLSVVFDLFYFSRWSRGGFRSFLFLAVVFDLFYFSRWFPIFFISCCGFRFFFISRGGFRSFLFLAVVSDLFYFLLWFPIFFLFLAVVSDLFISCSGFRSFLFIAVVSDLFYFSRWFPIFSGIHTASDCNCHQRAS